MSDFSGDGGVVAAIAAMIGITGNWRFAFSTGVQSHSLLFTARNVEETAGLEMRG